MYTVAKPELQEAAVAVFVREGQLTAKGSKALQVENGPGPVFDIELEDESNTRRPRNRIACR